MAKAKINDKRFEKPIEYYMDDRLKHNLDNNIIPDLREKRDKDYFMVVDGEERAGKSTLAFQIGKYVDPTLNLDRVVFNAEDFRKKAMNAKKGECIIFDEAFVGLSSRASLSGVNKTLVSMMMQVGQKNLFFIIVMPTFFLLDRYVAIWRSRSLVHVYESKGKRGYFKVYNRAKKKLLYLRGKQTYSYLTRGKYKIETSFKGRFYGKFALGDENEEKRYRKKKEEAFREGESTPMSAGQVKYKEQRNLAIYLMRKVSEMTYEEISNYMRDYGIELSRAQVGQICSRFGDKESKNELKPKEEEKEEENEE